MKELWVEHVNIHSDSRLVINQVTWTFEAKEKMKKYLTGIKEWLENFKAFKINQISHSNLDFYLT